MYAILAPLTVSLSCFWSLPISVCSWEWLSCEFCFSLSTALSCCLRDWSIADVRAEDCWLLSSSLWEWHIYNIRHTVPYILYLTYCTLHTMAANTTKNNLTMSYMCNKILTTVQSHWECTQKVDNKIHSSYKACETFTHVFFIQTEQPITTTLNPQEPLCKALRNGTKFDSMLCRIWKVFF